MFNTANTEFNFQKHLIALLHDVTFYAEISRHIRKVPTRDIPTLAVGFNLKTEDIEFGYNPEFCEKLTNLQMRNVIIHEFMHLIFGHLNLRRKEPPVLWNIATDCAINSIIVSETKNNTSGQPPFPNGVIIPGEWPLNPEGQELSEQEKKAATMGAIIASLPKMKASEFYYNKILEEAEKKGMTIEQIEGSGSNSFDSHDFWDQVPDDKKDLVEAKIKGMIEKAVKNADTSDGWGNIPLDLQRDIRRSVTRVVDWKAVLRQFAGSLVRGKKKTSIKKINKRYPYIHAGQTRGYTAKLLVAIDQSGSVDDGMLEMFFSELRSLNKKIEIDYLPFDCTAREEDIKTWPRGQIPVLTRTRSGGTDFNAPTRIVNDPKNRGRYDGFLIMTDGECSAPVGSRVKRGWVLGKGQKLMFDTSELCIKLDDGRVRFGAWR